MGGGGDLFGGVAPEKNFENRARSMARCRGNGEFGRGLGKEEEEKKWWKGEDFFFVGKNFFIE